MADGTVGACFIGARPGGCDEPPLLVCGTVGPSAAGDRAGSLVRWRRKDGSTVPLQLDLRPLGRSVRQQFQPVLGPGDRLTAPETATMGAALNHPRFGRVITTAGHAFVKAGYGVLDFTAVPRPVTMANVVAGQAAPGFSGHALKAVVSPDTDYAIVTPAGSAQNLFEDESIFAMSGVHEADDRDLGTPLLVLTCRGVVSTTLLGVHGAMDVGKLFAQGLLMTTAVTIPGDSGSCLVDHDFRLWGFLLGTADFDGDRYSVFIAPDWVLASEDAVLA